MKKRVAFVGVKGIPAVGGTARVCESIIEYLKKDYDITVYSMASFVDPNIKVKGFTQIPLPTIPIKRVGIYIYYLFAYISVIFKRYDVIHVHGADSGIFIPILKLLRKKVISTSHCRGQLRTDKFGLLEQSFLKISEKSFLQYSDIVTCVGKPLQDAYSSVSNKQTYFIPNGIKLNEIIEERFAKSFYDKFNLRQNNFLFFAAGRIIPSKGCHFLLEALKTIEQKIPLAIAGNLNHVMDYKKELEMRMKELNTSYIGFITKKEELLSVVKNSKYFIFPSTYEAMSMMLLEVASVKTPIICSDIPENTAVFDDSEVLFFESENVYDLAEKIKWAMDNPDLMKQKAGRAYKKLEEEYTWDKISSSYSGLYNNLILSN